MPLSLLPGFSSISSDIQSSESFPCLKTDGSSLRLPKNNDANDGMFSNRWVRWGMSVL